MGNKQSIKCIQIVIDLYNTCIETYLECQHLLKTIYDLDDEQRIQYDELQFYTDYNKLKRIILDMQTEIDEIEKQCELTPLYKVIDIGEILTDTLSIQLKYTEINNSIKKLTQTIKDYELKKQVLKSKFKNKKSNRKSGQKSKSVKVQTLETVKKVKSIKKSKKKSKGKRGL
jgi:SHS2 domain-containing protein